MESFVEKLKKYFDETPREKVISEWEKSKEFDTIGVTVDEFVKLNDIKNKYFKQNKMKIKDVRSLYPYHKISYLPKKSYLEGIDDSKSPLKKVRRKDLYGEVYIAKDMDNKYYLLYPISNSATGGFNTRQKAIDWFKNGGR